MRRRHLARTDIDFKIQYCCFLILLNDVFSMKTVFRRRRCFVIFYTFYNYIITNVLCFLKLIVTYLLVTCVRLYVLYCGIL